MTPHLPRLTLALAAAWTLSNAGLAAVSSATGDHVLALASTTLPRVAGWPVSLPVSGLLVRHDLPVWLAALALGAAPVERTLGWRRTLLLLGGVHVGATVLSQGLLGLRVALGDAPGELLTQTDVGPSYLAVAGLVAAAVLAPTRWQRLLAAGALGVGVPELLEGSGRLDLAATGHVAAAVLAAGAAWRWRDCVRGASTTRRWVRTS